MHITVKGAKGFLLDITVDEAGTVLDIQQAVGQNRSVDASTVKVIYGGHILKPEMSITGAGITEGACVHVVVQQPRQTPPPAPAPAPTPEVDPIPDPQPAPQPSNPFGGSFSDAFGSFGLDPQDMQEAMRQLRDNPEIMQQAMNMFSGGEGGGIPGMPNMDFDQIRSMMNNPMVQQMMQSFSENPQLYVDLLRNSPIFANNPMLQQILDDPQMLSQLMNLQSQLFGGGNTGSGTGTQTPNPGANPFASMFSQGFPGAAQPAPQPAPAPQPVPSVNSQDLFLQITGLASTPELTRTLSTPAGTSAVKALIDAANACRAAGIPVFPNVAGLNQGSAPQQPPSMSPQQRFGPQLAQMHEMGLFDDEANIRALIATNGNANAAIDMIFRS